MIRLATLSDVQAIMNFIHKEWKQNHILSQNKNFFLYEHQDATNVNFVISTDDNGQINGVLGFIPSSYTTNIDICTVIWKVSKKVGDPMLGIHLLNFLLNSGKYRTVMSVGINEKTINIYKFLNFFTGSLKQYVLINHTITNRNISTIPQSIQPGTFYKSNGYSLKLLNRGFNFDFEKYQENITYKDEQYFKKRYFDHPIYKYNVYGIMHLGNITSLIVTRIQNAEQSQVLRIVDFIGNECDIKHISKQFNKILEKEMYEYADFYCYGLNQPELLLAGFVEINPESTDLIIPNYFYPFLKKNVKINFFSNTNNTDNLRLFKADGDQDRPN